MAIINSIIFSSLDGSNGFRVDGAAANHYLGGSVSSAGDVNGDGFDDFIVGAAGANGGSYVVFGKVSAFNATLDLSSLDGSNGFRLDGSAYGQSLRAVSSAGDVNGDGFDDVIVGANSYYTGNAGYVVFGKASGFNASLDLSSLDGSNGFILTGNSGSLGSASFSVSSAGDVNGDGFDDVIAGGVSSAYGGVSYVVLGKASGFDARVEGDFNLVEVYGDNIGASVSGAGDVNGDGFDDVIVGASGADRNGNNSGSSYVVFGKASGFTTDLASIDGNNGFRLDGVAADDRSGTSVSNAGDINGDGFDDLLIGAPNDDPNGENSGSSYVVFGKASGFSASMNLSSLDGNNGFRLDGVAADDFSGTSVSNAGDVNGDGFDDLIIGAFRADPNGENSGSSYVVFGKAAGFGVAINLSDLDSNTGVRLDGVAAGDSSGTSVSGAGDINGDGFDDLLVGALTADINGNNSGASYVLFGSSNFGGSIVTFTGSDEDDTFTGTTAAERFEGNGGNDTLIGGGGADIFQGGAGDDVISLPDLDFQSVEGGTGIDTLELAGGGVHLDLADFHDEITGIETIDLTGSGNNTLKFSLSDLLTLSDTTHTFTVNGDSGDRVVGVNGKGWADGGIDGNYHIYTNRGMEVRIDVAVTASPPPPGVFSLTGLNGSNGFRLDGTNDYSGWSVSNAGDVNGDGFDDVMIGAPFTSPNGIFAAGSSYVVFGKATGFDAAMDLSSLDGNNGFRLDGVAVSDRSGRSVSSAGDVNGDGFDDVIIGTYNDFSVNTTYVVFGKATGFDASLELSSLDGSNGFGIKEVQARDSAGFSVSSAGDVNGDGFDDVIVGAYGADPNGSSSGSSYVVFGKASGFDAEMDLSSLNGSDGFRLDGAEQGDKSGFSVSGAGDVNGDGFDDVLIGAYGVDSNGRYAGASYVVFGKASGFDAAMDLSSLDGNNGFRLDGIVNDSSGRSVSDAGDVNGDGFDDVIIAAPGRTAGFSYVVFGKASGFDAAIDLSSLDGSNGFRLDGVSPKFEGGILVSNAGDFNGDGFDDLIVGRAASTNLAGAKYSDVSYVVYGKASGFGATLSLSNLDGSNGFRLDGIVGGPFPHTSVSGAGDVNGDGFDDLIVGDPDTDSSYVVFGHNDSGSGIPAIVGTPGDDNLTGTSAAERFEGGDGNDRMIGHGGADVFHGGAGNDRIRISDLGFQLVDGGSGDNDVLSLGGGNLNLNLDLADVRGKISGIEIIYLHGGSGDKTLTLTAADVLNLSDTSNTLKVNGNVGDRVVLQGNWADGGIQGNFHTYTSDAAASTEAAVLLVGLNVTADFA